MLDKQLMLAASSSRLASRASEIRRSTGVMPRSLAESNGMLSWRGLTITASISRVAPLSR